MSASIHPADQRLPFRRLVPLAIQHVLVMYAGAVAVPLIIGRAVNLPANPARRDQPALTPTVMRPRRPD